MTMETSLVVREMRTWTAAQTVPALPWAFVLETFLDTLSSPRTRVAHGRVVAEAMQVLGVGTPAELEPRELARYRAGLAARLDTDRTDRLSPATVSLKLAAIRRFLDFCRVAGVVRQSRDVIAFVLKSPSATVERPYQVLNATERALRLEFAGRHGPRDLAVVVLALGAGLRVSELVGVRLGDFDQDDGGAWWVRVQMGKGRKDRNVPLAPSVSDAVLVGQRQSADDAAEGRPRDVLIRYAPKSATDLGAGAADCQGVGQGSRDRQGAQPARWPETMAIETLRAAASPVVVQGLSGTLRWR
jgi:integrase